MTTDPSEAILILLLMGSIMLMVGGGIIALINKDEQVQRQGKGLLAAGIAGIFGFMLLYIFFFKGTGLEIIEEIFVKQ